MAGANPTQNNTCEVASSTVTEEDGDDIMELKWKDSKRGLYKKYHYWLAKNLGYPIQLDYATYNWILSGVVKLDITSWCFPGVFVLYICTSTDAI